LSSYWDSSAVLNAAVSTAVKGRLGTGAHYARLHTYVEAFHVMTGRGIPLSGGLLKWTADDCAAWLKEFAAKVDAVDLDKAELMAALEKAQSRNVSGGHVYDYLHALAADKANADELLTRNTSDFTGLTNAKVEWP